MLRVSIHAGGPEDCSRLTRTDWLDIGYQTRAPYANYKVVLFQHGIGEATQVVLENYPRWSSSLWDLIARATARALWPDLLTEKNGLPPVVQPMRRGCAFAGRMTAVIQHRPSDGSASRQLGQMVISQKLVRGVYEARVDEDLQNAKPSAPFYFTPEKLRPAELMVRAAVWWLNGGKSEFPPRPPLFVPVYDDEGGTKFARISRLQEPARTGFLRWCAMNGRTVEVTEKYPAGRAPADWFIEFLETAI